MFSFQAIISRLIRFCRSNKGLLFLFVFTFSLYVIKELVVRYKEKQNDWIESNVDYQFIYNDSQVKTNQYLFNYDQAKSKAKELTERLNQINSESKRIVPNARSSSKLFKDEYLIVELGEEENGKKHCASFTKNTLTNSNFVPECPFTNCHFTCDPKMINQSDALLVHHTSRLKNNSEIESYLNLLDAMQKKNRKDQIWILWHDKLTPMKPVFDRFKFNWTMSYRLDSEINDCTYGCTYLKTVSKRCKTDLNRQLKEDFNRRDNKALWFVSSCDSTRRNKFAHELSYFYPTKIYGQCQTQFPNRFRTPVDPISSILNFFLGAYSNATKFKKCESKSPCELNELLSNKFYLSFESKNCTNYITEKFWQILRTNMIPVVLQPNKAFYELAAPSNSFIHAQDFGYDVERLAAHLHDISTDFNKYFKYQKWKLDYDVVHSIEQTKRRRLCELCTKLNMETAAIYYENVSEWFEKGCI